MIVIIFDTAKVWSKFYRTVLARTRESGRLGVRTTLAVLINVGSRLNFENDKRDDRREVERSDLYYCAWTAWCGCGPITNIRARPRVCRVYYYNSVRTI